MSQRQSTVLTEVDQGELELAIVRPIQLFSDDVVASQRDPLEAFNKQIERSGIAEKTYHAALRVDKGQFSLWKGGDQTPKMNRMPQICRLSGNALWLQRTAWELNMGLHFLKSEEQLRAEAAELKAAALEAENKLMREILSRRV